MNQNLGNLGNTPVAQVIIDKFKALNSPNPITSWDNIDIAINNIANDGADITLTATDTNQDYFGTITLHVTYGGI